MSSFCLLIALTLAVNISLKDAVLLSSKNTPSSLITDTTIYSYHLEVSGITISEMINTLENIEFMFLIDATLDQSLYSTLDLIASQFSTIYFTITPPSITSYSHLRYSLHNFYYEEANAIKQLLKHLHWTNFIVACSSRANNLLIGSSIKESNKNEIFSYLTYNKNISQEVSDLFVGKMIKVTGIRKIIIIDDEKSINKIEKSFINKNLLRVGTIVVVSSRATWLATMEGSLIVVENGLETASSQSSYENLSIAKIITDINFATSNLDTVTKITLASIIEELYPTHITTSGYSILNIKNSQKVIVGCINPEVKISEIVYFPGNTTSYSASASTKLVFAIANGTSEIYNSNSKPYYVFSEIYTGAGYAVHQSNLQGGIANFEIELYPTNCGLYGYDVAWYTSCLKPSKEKLGIAYLSGFWYTGAASTLFALRNLNVSIPQISPFAQDNSVDNITEMPEFLKLSVSTANFFTAIFLFQRSLNWNEIVVLATNDLTFYTQYQEVIEFSSSLGITIANPPDKRVLPFNYTRNDFQQYKSYFQTAKDTNCRIYIIVAINRGLLWEAMYDIGLRLGDIILLTDTTAMNYFTEAGLAAEYLVKRQAIATGALAIKYQEWNGVLGKALKAELGQIVPSLPYVCMAYDTVSVVKEAINYMLEKGDDYEDPIGLGNVMRGNKLVGCLGSIFFDKNDNSRAYSRFSIEQIQSHNNTLILVDVAYIDKYSEQVITSVNELIWPIQNSTPSNYRPAPICPFDNYLIRDSILGRMMLYLISTIFLTLSLIVAYIAAKSGKLVAFTEMKLSSIISFADMMFISFFVFEFFQILAEGPDQESYRSLVSNFQLALSLDFSLYFELKFNAFWISLYTTVGLASVWILLSLIFTLNRLHALQNKFYCDNIIRIYDFLLPTIGHIVFLPIFSILMNIFLCPQSIGNELTDSFLLDDCTIFCYSGKHIWYTIAVFLCISSYIPTAIYYRNLWELTQPSLHIRTKPLYLSIMSIFQIILVILNKTLKTYDQFIHGIAMSVIIAVFIAITIYMQPYNYKRVTVFQVTALSMAFYGVFTATVFIELNMLLAWILTEFIGFIIILIAGLIVSKRFPELLHSRRGISISYLFKMQCFKSYQYGIEFQPNENGDMSHGHTK